MAKHYKGIYKLLLDQKKENLYSCSYDCTVWVLNLKTKSFKRLIKFEDTVVDMVIDSEG